MKTISLVLCFVVISFLSHAQKFETNMSISEAVTSAGYGAEKVALGFTLAVQEFYYLNQWVAIGTGLKYSYQDYNLIKDDELSVIDDNSRYESDIVIQSVNIPLNLRYVTDNNWIFQIGYGLEYVINTKSKVNYISSGSNLATEISDKSDDLGRDLNSFANVGFGKGFKIYNFKTSFQLFYEVSLHNYDFQHAAITSGSVYNYKLENHQIGLKFSLKLI